MYIRDKNMWDKNYYENLNINKYSTEIDLCVDKW